MIEPQEAAFFPDGRRILISTLDGKFVVATAKGRVIREIGLDTTDYARNFSISPDGRQAVWSDGEYFSGRRIHRLNLRDETDEFLTAESDDASGPVWSPDGRKVAYTVETWNKDHDQVTGTDVWVMNPDGTKRKALVSRPGEEILRDWGRAVPFRIVRYDHRRSSMLVRTWGPGKVSVRGPVFARQTRTARKAGIVRVPVVVKRGIRLRAGAKFKVNVRFAPKGALATTRTRFIKLG